MGIEHRNLNAIVVGLVCLAFFAGRAAFGATGVVNVLDHGAVGDGTTLNTGGPAEGDRRLLRRRAGRCWFPRASIAWGASSSRAM